MPLNLTKIRQWVDAECGSTAEAARRLGMQRENLSRLLGGDNADVRLSTLERLADAMQVDPAELIRRAVIV